MDQISKTTIGALAGAGVGYVIWRYLEGPEENFTLVFHIAGGALIGGAIAFFLWK